MKITRKKEDSQPHCTITPPPLSLICRPPEEDVPLGVRGPEQRSPTGDVHDAVSLAHETNR